MSWYLENEPSFTVFKFKAIKSINFIIISNIVNRDEANNSLNALLKMYIYILYIG